MSVTVSIGGSNRPYLQAGTATISRPKRGRATARFDLFDEAQAYRPVVGSPVILTDGSTTFRGLVMRVRESREQGIMSDCRYSVECSDYAAIFDHRFVSRYYPPMSLVSNIYADICQNFLLDDGFNTDGVDGFAAIANELKFDYRSVTECFDTIANLSGEDWWIGGAAGKTIYSKSLATSPAAPFTITGSSANWRALDVTYDSRSYRNRQFLRAAVPLQSGAITENFTGNGSQWFFATQFILTAAPTVTVGGVAQTIYRMGVDAYPAAGWWWIPGGGGVQEGTQTPVGNGVAVVVQYGSYESSVVMAESTGQQTARIAIEGGSGIWESVEEARDVDNIEVAEDLAQAILDRHSTMPIEIRYETDVAGIEPGMAQEVYLAANGIGQVTDTEMVTNGSFSTSSDWTLSGATIGSGKLTIAGVGNAAQAITLNAGNTYRVTFELFSGSALTILGSHASSLYSTPGFYTLDIAVTDIGSGTISLVSFAGAVIDNVSVKKLINQKYYVVQVDSQDIGPPFDDGSHFRHRVLISNVRDQTGWLNWWLNFYRSTKSSFGAASEAAALIYDK